MRRNTVWKWLILIVLLGYTGWAAVWSCRQADSQPLRAVSVEIVSSEPQTYVTEAGVRSLIEAATRNRMGKPIGDIDTEALERRLSTINSFESVECVKLTDGTLRVSVTPMKPEIRIFTDAESYYINKDGKRIDAEPGFHAEVPIVTGRFSRTFPPKAVLPVTRALQADPVMRDLTLMVKADGPNNIMLIPRNLGMVINLGDTADMARKIADIKLAYKNILPYRGWEYYDTVSVKFRGSIVASRRDKGPLMHAAPTEEEIDIEETALQAQIMDTSQPEERTEN